MTQRSIINDSSGISAQDNFTYPMGGGGSGRGSPMSLNQEGSQPDEIPVMISANVTHKTNMKNEDLRM